MDRNSIIGIIIIAAIFIVMGILNQPSKEQLEKQKRIHDSIARVEYQQKIIKETQSKEYEQTREQDDSIKTAKKAVKLGGFSDAAFGEDKYYTIENNLIAFTISTKGGRPYSARLKEYKTYDSLPVMLFNGDSTVFDLQFYSRSNAAISTNDLYFEADSTFPADIKVTDKPVTIRFRLKGKNDQYLEYSYTLKPNVYQVDMNIGFHGISDPTNRLSTLDLNWSIYSPRQEKGWKNEALYSSIYYKSGDDVNFTRTRKAKSEPEDINTQVEWLGFKDQFFATVIMADNNFQNAQIQTIPQKEDSKYINEYKSELALTYRNTGDSVIPLHFFFGPNKFKLLKKEYGDKKMQDMVSVGRSIIKWINQGFIINMFNWLSRWISNYGIIILIMTIIIKMMLLPLTFRSYVSQAKMRVLKPMVDEITAKIPKDKAVERQQKTMELYRKVGVSPLGGCLPMILQMPILFAMFRFFPTSIELRQQAFLWAKDLSTYDAIFEWHRTIPFLSSIYGNHVSLFTILMTVTTLLTMKSSGSAQMGDSQMPGMKTMMYIMPVTFMFILNRYSAALTYYYFLANIITFGQNYLFKMFIDEDNLLKKLEAKKAKPKKKSNWQKRMEEMQKMQKQTAKRR